MHRILRPKGAVIIRDQRDVVLRVKEITDRIGWKGVLVGGNNQSHIESGPNIFNPELIMVFDNTE